MAHKSTRRRSRRLLLLVLLLVSTATASLALLDKRPSISPAPVLPRDLYASEVCDANERDTIAETREAARRWLAAAVRLVETQGNHPLVREWFGVGARPVLMGRLRRMATILNQFDRVTVTCHGPLCRPGVLAAQINAHATLNGWHIGFCENFFRYPPHGLHSRLATMVHEVSHLVGADDHEWGPDNARALARRQPATAAANAYNYGHFVAVLADTPAAAVAVATSGQARPGGRQAQARRRVAPTS